MRLLYDDYQERPHTRRSLPSLDVRDRLRIASLPKTGKDIHPDTATKEQSAVYNWFDRLLRDAAVMHPEMKMPRDRQGLRVESDKNLVISGGRQVGKTAIAATVLKSAIQCNKVTGYFAAAPQLFSMFTDAERNGGVLPDTYGDPLLLDFIKSKFEFVVVDDLGTETITEFKMEAFRAFLVERHNNRMPVVFTTRLSKGALQDRYDERTVEYLTLDADVIVLQVP